MELMDIAVYVLGTTVSLFLGLLEVAFLLRALLSFFMTDEEGFFATLLHGLTEPFVLPVRWLLSLFGLDAQGPFDIAFSVTFLLIWLIGILLPTVAL